MSLVGWGADREDVQYDVEVVHQRTGEKRTFRFETPTGERAVALYQDDAAATAQRTAEIVMLCCPELADEDPAAVERLIALTGGAESPLLDAIQRCLVGRAWDAEAGWDKVRSAVPTSPSARD